MSQRWQFYSVKAHRVGKVHVESHEASGVKRSLCGSAIIGRDWSETEKDADCKACVR